MWSALLEKFKGVATSWSAFTALGSFVLYFLGYLVLRFQLSTWGVATDLSILDERYLFAGARFLVYLISTAVNVLLLASPLMLFWWLLNRWSRFRQWRETWDYAMAGVIFAVLFIQLVEKKCFQFMNSVLFQSQLDGERWLQAVLLDSTSYYEAQFFAALVAGVAATGWLLFQCHGQKIRRPMLESVLLFLFLVEFLLLPVNYGVIVSSRELPKVATFAPAEAWLVWEGKDKTTFLVVNNDRKLVAVPNADLKKLEIIGVENVFQRLFPTYVSGRRSSQ
jgi:hypothetical protein